jgi:lysophospholipase L1-like esterase
MGQTRASLTGREQFVAQAGKLAAIGLTVGALLAAFVCARFLYLDWSGQRQFRTTAEIVLYYVVPAGSAVLLLGSLRLTAARRLRLAVSCITFMVSVYTVELFLTAFQEPEIKPVMAVLAKAADKGESAAALTRQFGVEIDYRTPTEALGELQQKSADAVRIVTPSDHLFVDQPDGSIKSAINLNGREVMPLGGISSRLTLLCNEEGKWIDYRSDSRGFNNPDEIWQFNRLEIAAVGDSYTQGYCVPADRNFVALIRQRHASTINLGIAGNGSLLMLATLTEYLPRVRPKIVLWFYYEGNDLTDLQRERRSALLTRYLEDDFRQPELARQSDLDRAIMAEIPRLTAKEQSDLRQARTNALAYTVTAFAKLTALRTRLNVIGEDAAAIEMAADLEAPNMDAFRDALTQAKTRVDAWGGRLIFVYLPEWAHYTRYRSWGKTKYPDVLKLVNSLGIATIDIVPVFQAHGDPLSLFPLRGVGHYNEAGHRLVADEVLRRLQSSHGNGSH